MKLDHITFACTSLDQAQRYAAAHFGVELPIGGEHLAMGTHNLLTRISAHTFLEFIAINPAAKAPNRKRWFNLDGFADKHYLADSPKLIGWVASVKNMACTIAALPFELGHIHTITRAQLSWKMSIPDDGSLPHQGYAPTLIEWDQGQSPVANMRDVGIQLLGFGLHHPLAESWHSALKMQGWQDGEADHERMQWVNAEQPALKLNLATPKGNIMITTF